MNQPALESALWSNVTPEPNSGCWLWLGDYSLEGHPVFEFAGELREARILAWRSLSGTLPARGSMVVSICGEGSCVNPAHLGLRAQPPAVVSAAAAGAHAP